MHPAQVGHDLFLDFMNRDTRQMFALYRVLSQEAHADLLGRALNFCAFLARDACVIPPGFLAEDPLVRTVLESKRAYKDARLIRLPMRESLDEFWAKKEREYATVRDRYEGLFDVQGQRFVEENQNLLVGRDFEIGPQLVARWEAAPDESPYWKQQIRRFPTTVVELFRRVPERLAEEGRAVTWASISDRIAELARRHPSYRRLVQHIYFGVYLQALDLRVITGLPALHDTFGLGSRELFYDFQAMESLVAPTELWPALLEMPSDAMMRLRRTSGYFRFRRNAWELCGRVGTHYELRESAALQRSQLTAILAKTEEVENISSSAQVPLFHVYRNSEIQAIGERLADFSAAALDRRGELESNTRHVRERRHAIRQTSSPRPDEGAAHAMPDPVMIGIFASLKEERDVLIRALRLEPLSSAPPLWTGRLPDGVAVRLFSADMMGRVPAAVSTARFLTSTDVSVRVLLLLGVAGGFQESKVELGDILIPYTVADLASRKVTTDGNDADSRVRPQPYELDKSLGRYIESVFPLREWSARVADRLEWPAGRQPRLGPAGVGGILASVDEVVASNTHREKLLAAWPGLLGVEMEAGGVLAAVREFRNGLPVIQVRCVSDMADPAKSDTVWRKLGMKTVADLVSSVKWRDVLEPSR